jgi:hypothetical protein
MHARINSRIYGKISKFWTEAGKAASAQDLNPDNVLCKDDQPIVLVNRIYGYR